MMSIRRKHLLRDVVPRFLISNPGFIVVVAGDAVGTCSRFIYECCFDNNKLDGAFHFFRGITRAEIPGRDRFFLVRFFPMNLQ